MKRLKILISAYACSPTQGSEPGVGWQFTKAIARHHDVWVITETEKFQAEIEAELDRCPELHDSMHFHYILKRRGRKLRKIWPPSYYWFYGQWQRKAYELARSLHEEIGFDLIHQLNMVGFREPGYLWKLPLPFVWGPVGGMGKIPWRFMFSGGPGQTAYRLGYNLFNAMHMRMLRRPVHAARRAEGGLIAATSEMQARMLDLWSMPSDVICEVGQAAPVVENTSARQQGDALKLTWCAWHEPGKSLPLLLNALGQLNGSVKWELDVIGSGPCSDAWKARAARLGIRDNCRWHGALSRDKALSIMRAGHLFVITSIKDLTSTVVLEAISQAVPVLCLDNCGFADVITEDCGIRIPVSNPRRVSAEIAEGIKRIWDDEEYRRRLARGALQRSGDFSWEAKAEQLNEIYQRSIDVYRQHRHESLLSS